MSNKYSEQSLISVAKRVNNNKRKYLLVNPLQSKHMPVDPQISLEMMSELGKRVAGAYPDARLVIGFAETATAIGAVVAKCISNQCEYIHTTRELINSELEFLEFKEEHSHAVEQELCSSFIAEILEQTGTVVFVDDEITSGKTLINIVCELRKKIECFNNKKIIIASIINRLSDENKERLEKNDIEWISLVHINSDNYEEDVEDLLAFKATPKQLSNKKYNSIVASMVFQNPRTGVAIGEYYASLNDQFNIFIFNYRNKIRGDVLVLGTEECMLPAIILGCKIKDFSDVTSVKCHATTRSPIGVCEKEDYPIKNGTAIRSVYDESRETFVYNTATYDSIIIVTDSNNISEIALNELIYAVSTPKAKNIIVVKGA